MDMIFTARQFQEKCCEQQRELYVAFVDLTKVNATVCGRYMDAEESR